MTDTVNVPADDRAEIAALVADYGGNAAYDAWKRIEVALAAAPPSSYELLETLEGIVHFSDGFTEYGKETTLGRALTQWINGARSLLAKHKGPQS